MCWEAGAVVQARKETRVKQQGGGKGTESGHVWKQRQSGVSINLMVVWMLSDLGPTAPGFALCSLVRRYFFPAIFYVSGVQPASDGWETEGSPNFAASLEGN